MKISKITILISSLVLFSAIISKENLRSEVKATDDKLSRLYSEYLTYSF